MQTDLISIRYRKLMIVNDSKLLSLSIFACEEAGYDIPHYEQHGTVHIKGDSPPEGSLDHCMVERMFLQIGTQITYLQANQYPLLSIDPKDIVQCGENFVLTGGQTGEHQTADGESIRVASPYRRSKYATPLLRNNTYLPALVPSNSPFYSLAKVCMRAVTNKVADGSRLHYALERCLAPPHNFVFI